MPTTSAPHSITSTVLSPDSLVAVTLTNELQFDGTQAFSLGAWLLIEPGDAAGDLFSAGDNFSVSLSESGEIQGNFGAGSWTPANANAPISRWFYLLITAEADAANNSASVSLYFDGALADAVTVGNTGGGTSTQLTIGGAVFQCIALNVWNTALPADAEQFINPNWTLPSSAQNIIAAVDFTQNPPLDTGPSHYALSYTNEVPCQFCNTPALYLNGAASASLTSPSTIVPKGHFSLGLWCYVELSATFNNQISLLQISSTDGKQNLTLSFAIDNNTVSVFVTAISDSTATTAPYQLPLQTWSVLGVNFDGQKIYLSINASVVSSTSFNGFSEPLSCLALGSTPGNLGTQNFSGYLQSFFVVPNNQSAPEIYALLTTGLGSQTYNCVLEFGGAQTLDQVTCAPVEMYQANIADQLLCSQVQGMNQAPGQRIVRPSAGPVIPQQVQHRFASVKSDNPDIVGYNLDVYEQLLSALPESARKAQLRQSFQQRLQEGFDRARTSDWAVPKVQCELINGKYRFTLSKPFIENDVFEIDEVSISNCAVWSIQIAAQCVGIVLQMFGFAFSLSGLIKALTAGLNQRLLGVMLFEGHAGVAGLVVGLINETNIDALTIVKIIRTLYNADVLIPVITNALVGVSWWNWAFTLTGLMISIVGIWVTGGWYLAIMLAQLALSVGQLVEVAKEKPKGC